MKETVKPVRVLVLTDVTVADPGAAGRIRARAQQGPA